MQLNLRLTLSEISALFLPTRYPFLHVLITETFSNTGSPEGSLTGFNFQLRTVFLSHNLEGLLPFFGISVLFLLWDLSYVHMVLEH